jgi:hypothetical protein
MRSFTKKTASVVSSLAILAALFCAVVAAPLSSAHTVATGTIKVVNNSGRVMIHLYLSPTTAETWSDDLLNDATLSSGQEFTLSNVSCDGSEIRVIGEDVDGCFVSGVVSCTGEATWTITTDAVPNCGN